MSLPLELAKIRDEIRGYAKDYGLDFFETIFEMVDSDQVNSIAALGGFPVRYPHWRFGMDYDQLSKNYEWGFSKIYELVINTDPSYAYLVRANPLVDQKLVMAHVYGHVDFFKNNYWFSKTDRKMLDTMANHAVRIRGYMDQFGQDDVEKFIDRCLSIENLIDPYLPFAPPKDRSKEVRMLDNVKAPQTDENVGRLKNERSYMESFINPKEFLAEEKRKKTKAVQQEKRNPSESMRDVMLFLLENAPLEEWQREVLRIVRAEAYYFAPQMQTKIMNEGWASYWHSEIMTKKAARDSEILDFADRHSGAMVLQPGRMNPYKVGIELFRDIEDRWNRGAFGPEYEQCDDLVAKAKWDKKLGKGREKIFEVRRTHNDVTFLDQFLTPEFIERFQLYTYEFNRRTNRYEIVDRDFGRVKEKMLSMLSNAGQPLIFVEDGNFENRGELHLSHRHQGVDLDLVWAKETMKSISEIWSRPVALETEVEGVKKFYAYHEGDFGEKAKKP